MGGDFDRRTYEDSMVAILVSPTSDHIQFQLTNKTDRSLWIVWDEAAFTHIDGKMSKVMHTGTKYIDRNWSQPPSLVPPHQSFGDGAWPTDRVVLQAEYQGRYGSSPGDWAHRAIVLPDLKCMTAEAAASPVPDPAFAAVVHENIGKRMGLLLPIQMEGVVHEYMLWFQITDAKTAGPYDGQVVPQARQPC
jgi:hypothetical protein